MAKYTTPSGIELHYEAHGHSSNPPVMLIMGLGAQLTTWPTEFIDKLVEKHLYVICFDNRDVGLSSKLHKHGKPKLMLNVIKRTFRMPEAIPYTLEDMANDVTSLMDGLNISKAHLVGTSMGGMIAQIIAAKHHQRCISLVSMMSSPSGPAKSKSSFKVLFKLLRTGRNLRNKRSLIEQNVKLNQLIGSPAFPIEESQLWKLATTNIERCHYPDGYRRQLAAVAFSRNRVPLLNQINVPTLILHGSEDPLIPWQIGVETAIHIPKAKIHIVRGMGHNIPPVLCAKLTKKIAKHIYKAEQKAGKNPKRKSSPWAGDF